MRKAASLRGHHRIVLLALGLLFATGGRVAAQQLTAETRDPKQAQDQAFAKLYAEWTPKPKYGSPLVDHLPLVKGIPTPKDVIGYYVGAPRKLTYYADQLKYYRALAAATPRVKVEVIGKSDEGRDLVVVWVSSDANMKKLAQNRKNLAQLADPRGLSEARIQQLIATTRPDYHIMGGLHSGETGPSEMLMELVYRIATETSPIITKIRDNVYVSVTPVADADGRDRNVDWYYRGLAVAAAPPATGASGRGGDSAQAGGGGGGGGGRGGRGGGIGTLPYWGKYVYHDNNRDINLSLMQIRAIADWYFTAHPPIMHDLHESMALLYTYSGGPPQNPNLDPLLFAELPWFSNWELAQMTKWGMPGVYDFAFMDGWSPGYLGSIAYNHNGMMKMYETQSGRDPTLPGTATAGGGRGVAGVRGAGGGRGASGVPTGRGGAQDREWYRGIAIGPDDAANFTRRVNTNYMETGVLSSLQLTSMFPATIVENFYIKSRNSIEEGKTKAPFGFVIPVRPDMTRAAELVNILRIQGIEVGVATQPVKVGDSTYAAGSYIIKRDQPYGRLAKNLLEKQIFPDARLTTYDDSGWSMGLAMMVDVVEVADSTILKAPVTPVTTVVLKGKVTGSGTAGIAVAHLGSNNMIAFRYQLKTVPMTIAEAAFTTDGITFPAGSFVITDMSRAAEVRSAVEQFGLTGVALTALPTVAAHNADAPRIAIYSQWSSTQDLGWYRLTFDKFHIPYDLIYKERVAQGNLGSPYDVIVMAAQTITKQAVMQAPASTPQPYQKSAQYQNLGRYGETADMSGGFGQAGVDAFTAFLDGGGTLIAAADAVRFPIDFGWAHTVETAPVPGLTAQRPVVQGEILHPENPVFYGYPTKLIPLKYIGGSTLKVGVADQDNVLARYVGGDASVLTGLMVGADSLRSRPFAVDIPGAHNGRGRVILFSNNPIYRWQNHGEFNMIFNAIMNWNDVPAAKK